jgi:hypothetical protein
MCGNDMEEGNGEASFVFFEFECCFGCGYGLAVGSYIKLYIENASEVVDGDQVDGV